MVRVVVGRKGLRTGRREARGRWPSPGGTYSLGTAFGVAGSADFRVPYRQLKSTTECVDDSASRYYNQIVDRDEVPAVDWSSSEKMRAVDQYRWGIVVNYNTPAAPQRGSCIFLHIWSGPSSTTAGCTAMKQEDLETVLRWLDPAANPRLVQFTRGRTMFPLFLRPLKFELTWVKNAVYCRSRLRADRLKGRAFSISRRNPVDDTQRREKPPQSAIDDFTCVQQ